MTVIGPQMLLQSEGVSPVADPFESSGEIVIDDEGQISESDQPAIVDQGPLVSECKDGSVEITSPEEGQTVSGTVDIIGTVNIDNFGSYKYEYSRSGTINWITIAAGNQLKLNESLGFWYTSELPPGTYLLQLVFRI